MVKAQDFVGGKKQLTLHLQFYKVMNNFLLQSDWNSRISLTLTELTELFGQVGLPLLHSLDLALFGCFVFSTHMCDLYKIHPYFYKAATCFICVLQRTAAQT